MEKIEKDKSTCEVKDEPICKIKDILSREQQAIAAHVEKYIGTVTTVYTPEDSEEPVISILEVAPSKGRDGWTYVTCGASLKEQDLPYNTPDWIIPRTEYLCYVKDKAIWPVDVLNLLGRLPFEKSTHLFWWHTVNYLSPLDEDSETTQSALLLLPPYFEDEDFDNFALYGDDVRFLMALPITEEERSFAAEYGGQRLEEKLLSANSDFIFDPKRESTI
jgi:hypothetical protein